MPTLILTPRFTPDSQALWKASLNLGWDVERLSNWHIPHELLQVSDPVFYLEGLFAQSLAEQFGYSLLEPPMDWLVSLPYRYKKRNINISTLGFARTLKEEKFVKPPIGQHRK